ncbi:MAG TPA: hypothetical protein VLG50_01995 [Candidatus Saccharimonadales bacterium]|nr:hypothetical protein [Candidatus Saccharimonadales bacterium]
MNKIIIIIICFFLLSCDKNYHVALYQDQISKDSILCVYQVSLLEAAMSNCQYAMDLYKADDRKKGYFHEYYCQEIL